MGMVAILGAKVNAVRMWPEYIATMLTRTRHMLRHALFAAVVPAIHKRRNDPHLSPASKASAIVSSLRFYPASANADTAETRFHSPQILDCHLSHRVTLWTFNENAFTIAWHIQPGNLVYGIMAEVSNSVA